MEQLEQPHVLAHDVFKDAVEVSEQQKFSEDGLVNISNC